MSISVAPSATAIRTSCSRVSSGVWPAGKPVATGRGGNTNQQLTFCEVHYCISASKGHYRWDSVSGDLPEATGRLELAAFSDFTASATRDGYTHTAAVVTPGTQHRQQNSEEQTLVCVALCRLNSGLSRQSEILNSWGSKFTCTLHHTQLSDFFLVMSLCSHFSAIYLIDYNVIITCHDGQNLKYLFTYYN